MRTHCSLGLAATAALLCLVPGPAEAIHGLIGSYYTYDGGYLEDFSFSDPGYHHAFDRLDPALSFGWSEEHYSQNNGNGWGFDWEPYGPDAGAFGVRWDGYINIPEGPALYLGTESDDGSYVHIDDALFVDNGGQHWPWFRWSDTVLEPGRYRITTYLFVNDLVPPIDKSGIDLWWSVEQGVVDDSGWVPSDWLDPVPEPSSLALLLAGLGGAALARRRRR